MSINYSFVPRSSSSLGTLRSEPLLSPPRSHDSSERIPFKPDAADPISLTMKKGKGHGESWHNPFSASSYSMSRTATTRLSRDGSSSWRRSGTCISPTLRKTISLPAVQLRRTSQKPESQARSVLRSRRWTIPSKATSTRAIVTNAPIPETTSRVSKKTKMAQSPAMITLRRATGSPKRMSLTYFPTPRFSRRNSGFLSSFFTTFSSQGQQRISPSEGLQVIRSETNTPPPPSIDKNEARPAISSVAAPIFTKLTPIPTRLPLAGQHVEEFNSLRRCSTKYVSESAVFEIIWDDDAYGSSPEVCTPSPPDRDTGVGGNVSVDTTSLERRLSKVLTQSRISSVLPTSRRTSWWQGSETFPRGFGPLMESPKLAKIVREAGFRNLPRSRYSTRPAIPAPLANEIDAQQQLLGEPSTAPVENIFPPLTDGRNNIDLDPLSSLMDEPNRTPPFSGSSKMSLEFDEESLLTRRRSRFGSMMGVSRHQKWPQALPERGLSIRERRRSAMEGFGKIQHGHQEGRSIDDVLPLLGTF
ncbi:hypothetical protein H2204_005005 [Knufia peltigerae]|uniref:Uncharacterized protein n=1 Tax=Knufia peltigerae TaxID=1002370 RepID=A0AA38Y6F6_9EURO|nr:hypothetical protein H2204_005005 [Knufia peltigerae]